MLGDSPAAQPLPRVLAPRSGASTPNRTPLRVTTAMTMIAYFPQGGVMVKGYTARFPCLRFSFVGWANNWALGPLPTYPAYLGAPLVSWITRDLLMSPCVPSTVTSPWVNAEHRLSSPLAPWTCPGSLEPQHG